MVSPSSFPARRAAAGLVIAVLTGCASGTGPVRSSRAPLPPNQARPAELTPPPAPPPPPAPVIPERLLVPGATLALAEIVDIALQNNPATRTSYFQARSAAALLGSKMAPYYPTVDLSASASRAKTSTPGTDEMTVSTYGPAVTLNYLLLDLGGRAANVEDARQALLAADWSHNATIQNVILAVQQTLTSQYLNAKAQLEAARTTVTTGAGGRSTPPPPATTPASRRSPRSCRRSTALSQAQLIEHDLRRAGARRPRRRSPPPWACRPTRPTTSARCPPRCPLDTHDRRGRHADRQARTRRPDLAGRAGARDKATAHVRAVRSDGLPTLSRSAGGQPDVLRPRRHREHATVGRRALLVTFPLFTGFANSYNVAKAREDVGVAAGPGGDPRAAGGPPGVDELLRPRHRDAARPDQPRPAGERRAVRAGRPRPLQGRRRHDHRPAHGPVGARQRPGAGDPGARRLVRRPRRSSPATPAAPRQPLQTIRHHRREEGNHDPIHHLPDHDHAPAYHRRRAPRPLRPGSRCAVLAGRRARRPCGGDKADSAAEPPPVPVTVGKAVVQDVPVSFRAIGHVEPIATVAVKARIGGELQKVSVHGGPDGARRRRRCSRSTRGQYQAALAQAEAQLGAGPGAARQGRRRRHALRRSRRAGLRHQGAVRPDHRERRRAARRRRGRPGERRQRRSCNLAYCTITAPVRGPHRRTSTSRSAT